MSWDDGKHGKVTRVQLTYDDVIRSIQVAYDGNSLQQPRGPVGSKSDGFTLGPDEYITDLTGYTKNTFSGDVITALTFKTNKKIYGPYGNKTRNFFSATPPKGQQIAGFHGSSSTALNSIDVHFAPILPPGSTGGSSGEGATAPPSGSSGGGTTVPPGGSSGGGATAPPGGTSSGGATAPPGGTSSGGATVPPGGSSGGGTTAPPGGSSGGGTTAPPGGSSGGGTTAPPGGSSGGGTTAPPGGSNGGGTTVPPGGSSGGGTTTPPGGSSGGGTTTPPGESSGGGTTTPPGGSSDGGTTTPPGESSGGGTTTPPGGSSGGGTTTPPGGSNGGGTIAPPSGSSGGGANTDPSTQKVEAQGGKGGNEWDDGSEHDGVTKIHVAAGFGIELIKFDYIKNGQPKEGPSHGVKGGRVSIDTIEIDHPKEYIISVDGWYSDDTIQGLEFKTNTRTLPYFGFQDGTHFKLEVKDKKIVGFHGFSDSNLNSIGAYFAPIATAITPLKPAKKLNAIGGDGGATWDDGSFDGVKKIYVGQGNDGVAFLMFEYNKGSQVIVGDGRGKKTPLGTETFELDYPSEYITSVEGYYDKLYGVEAEIVTSLTFKTNKRTSPPFGMTGGEHFVLKDEGNKIVGFHGKAGDYVHQVGVYVVPITTN